MAGNGPRSPLCDQVVYETKIEFLSDLTSAQPTTVNPRDHGVQVENPTTLDRRGAARVAEARCVSLVYSFLLFSAPPVFRR